MYSEPGAISFPGLGIESINPPRTLPFTIFGREIYLYGIIIAFGFLLAILYVKKRVKQFGTSFDLVTDAILFAVPLAIVCARIYYVAFQWEQYKDNPISVLYIWQGGIAIYGGVIGAILGLLLFAKVKKQKLTPYLDIMALGLLIGQCVGRWGNFFNREAHGAEIFNNFFLRMGIAGTDGVMRYWHPTFFYESLWNFVGFFLLHFLSKKRKYDGQTFLQYLAWYGLGRVWIEGLRTDSLYIGDTGLRVSQLLAGVSFVAAVAVMLYIRLFKKPDGSGMLVNQASGIRHQASGDEGREASEDQGSGDEGREASGIRHQASGDEGCEASEDQASGIRHQASGDEGREAPVTSHQSSGDEENEPVSDDAVGVLTERPPEAEEMQNAKCKMQDDSEATGNGQQATEDEGCEASEDQGSEDEKNEAAGSGALDAPLSGED